MTITVELSPQALSYLTERVASGEFPSIDACLNALIQDRIAEDARYGRWFETKVSAGCAAANSGDFASAEQIDDVPGRWR